MPPQQQNQYDFIMNDAPKSSRGPLFGGGMGARIAVIAVLFILIVIIGMVANSFLNKDQKIQTERLVKIAQTQTEIIRVSALAKSKAKDINTRNFALTTGLSVQSSQQDVKKLLSARGVNEKSLGKKIGGGKDAKTDAALDEATKNSRFDETFLTIMNTQLTNYQKSLQVAFPDSKKNERIALTASFDNAGRLVKKPESETSQ